MIDYFVDAMQTPFKGEKNEYISIPVLINVIIINISFFLFCDTSRSFIRHEYYTMELSYEFHLSFICFGVTHLPSIMQKKKTKTKNSLSYWTVPWFSDDNFHIDVIHDSLNDDKKSFTAPERIHVRAFSLYLLDTINSFHWTSNTDPKEK